MIYVLSGDHFGKRRCAPRFSFLNKLALNATGFRFSDTDECPAVTYIFPIGNHVEPRKMVAWKRLIRFEDGSGKVYNGEPIVQNDEDVGELFESGKLEAFVIEGNDVYDDCVVSQMRLRVRKLLGPLSEEQVPIIRCVGLNYMLHIKEAGRKPPPYPSIFFKPNTCVADYGEAIAIPKLAQDEQCDYEGELVYTPHRISAKSRRL